MTLGQALMVPTRIYVPALLALHRAGLLKAAAHITGGGLPGNVPRVLPEGTVAVLEPAWPVPPVFGWLARTGGVAADGDAARVQLRDRHGGGGGRPGCGDGTAARPGRERRPDRSHRSRKRPARVRIDLPRLRMAGTDPRQPDWPAMRRRTAILISGRGSNMAALIAAARDPAYPAEIVLVVSNRPDAAGLALAREAGVAAVAIDHGRSAATARRTRRRSTPRCGRRRSRSSASPATCGC